MMYKKGYVKISMLRTNSESPIMTKYEFTRVIGVRIQQLADGMPSLVDHESGASYKDIAVKELFERKLPLIVSRPISVDKKIEIPVSMMDFCKINV